MPSITLSLLSIFPQVQMIALCNSQAMGEADENSDIDLFIVTRKGNLWTARFIVTVITSILGVRRRNTHGLEKGGAKYIKRTKDKFCLSFFVTEEAMNLDPIRIENDVYLDKWIHTLVPLVNKDNMYEKFMTANGVQPDKSESKVGVFFNPLAIFSLLEETIKKLWLPKTLKTYEKLGKPWGVVISDTMLKFHDTDQRKVYRDSLKREHC